MLHTTFPRSIQHPNSGDNVEASAVSKDITGACYRRLVDSRQFGETTARNALIHLWETGEVTANYALGSLDRLGLLGTDEDIMAAWVIGIRALAAQRHSVPPELPFEEPIAIAPPDGLLLQALAEARS